MNERPFIFLSEPRFDDEKTVFSARPVVPLERIDAELKRRKRWFLGGAFALAMMLGAASALVTAYFKMRVVSTPEALETASLPAPEIESEESVETFEPRPSATVNPKRVTAKPRPAPRRAIRRARRLERPERGLANLDEIFEGRRRPE